MPDILTYKINGEVYDIPEDKVSSFLKKYPDALKVESFAVGKDTFDIPQEKAVAFKERYPDATPLFGDTEPVTSPNIDTIVNEDDKPVPESDAQGFLSESFKKGAEWVGRSGLMNSVFFKGFMAQGMIQSKMEGGGTAQEGMDLYREESQKQREKLAEHDPTGLENTLAFVTSMTLDAIPFAGYGTMGKGAAIGTLRGLNAAKNFMVSQGLKVGTVNKALPKAAKITGEILKGSATTGTALGGHTFSSGLLTALEEHDIDDILYSEELRGTITEPAMHSAKTGVLLGPVGFGTGVGMQLAQRGIKNNIGRFLATKGIQTAGFGGEVTTFAGVGALLNDEKLTWDGPGGLKETAIQLGALKLSHSGTAAGKKLLDKSFRQSKEFAEDKAGEGIYELHLTENEGKKLGLGDETTKEYLDRADKAGELGKIMEDPDISMTTKAKLLWSARGVEMKDLPPPAEVVIKGNEVELRDIEGGLIDSQMYTDKGEALKKSLSWQKTIEQNEAARTTSEFDAEQWSSVDRQLREAGIDKDALNESGAMLKHWDDLTPKEKESRDKIHDIIAEVSEPEVSEKPAEPPPKAEPAQKPKEEAPPKEETSKKIKFKPDLSVEGQQKAVTSNEVAIWEEFSKYGDTLGKAIKKIDDILSDKTTSASEKKKLSSLKEEIGDRITGPEDLNTSIQENIDFWKGLEQEPVRSAEKQKEIVKPSTQTSEEAWREVGREAMKKVKEGEKSVTSDKQEKYDKLEHKNSVDYLMSLKDSDVRKYDKYVMRSKRGEQADDAFRDYLKDNGLTPEEFYELRDKAEQPAEKPETLAEIQESTKKIIEDQEGPKPPPPELTTKDQVEVTLGGRTFKDNPIKVKPNGDIVIDHFGLKTIKKGDYKVVGKEKPKEVEPIKEEVKPVEKAEPKKGSGESLLASFSGYTGYWDAPKEKRGKLEESRDDLVELLTKDRDKALESAQDPVEARRLDNYYKKQLGRVKKIFSRDKAVAQKLGLETRRDLFHDYIQENRKELSKVHGNVVPAMMQRLTAAHTKTKIRDAFDYIQKVLDKKAEKDEAVKVSDALDRIDTTTDPSHKIFKAKGSKDKYKNNDTSTKEVIEKLDRIREHFYLIPDGRAEVPKEKTIDGQKLTAREVATLEVEKMYEDVEVPTLEQANRAEELWFTDMGNMTYDEIYRADAKIQEILTEGRTKSEELRQARLGNKKTSLDWLDKKLTGKDKDTAPIVIGGKTNKRRPTIIGDIVVGNRNWSSMLDRFSVNELMEGKGSAGVYDTELHRNFDKGMTQPAELETKTLQRERSEEMVENFTKAFEPTLDPKKHKYNWQKRGALQEIALRNETELMDISYRGITDKPTSERRRHLEITRDELMEIYQKMEDPDLARTLSKGGIHIPSTDNRKGGTAVLKRPVMERNDAGKLEWTGEYENTDLGNRIYEALDATSELGKEHKNAGLKEMAEGEFKLYEKWGDEISPVHEEVFGPPLSRRGKYTPISRYVDKQDGATPESMLDNQTAFAMGSNRHLYKMTNSSKPITILGSRRVMSSYMNKMSQFQGKSRAIQELNMFWRDKDIQETIRNEYGKNHVEWINQFLDQFAGQKGEHGKTIKWMDMVRRNLMVASLGAKPMIYMKQLTSLPMYGLFLPPGQLTKGLYHYMEAVTGNSKEGRMLLDKIKNDPYILNRYNKFVGNMDRDITEIQQRAQRFGDTKALAWNQFQDLSMGLIKLGDRAPIMAGGFAVYRYHYKKNLHKGEAVASKIAAREFMHSTKSTQQASDISDLSSYQRGGSWMKMATMYMTAPMSYHRIASGGLRRFNAGMKTGNKKMMKAGARQFFIAHVVMPVIFQAASNGFQFDTEDKKWDLARAAILGNANSLFAIGDILDHAADKLMGKPFDYQTLPAASIAVNFGKAWTGLRDFFEKEEDDMYHITIEEIINVADDLSEAMAYGFGIPLPGISKMTTGVRDIIRGETESFHDSLLRAMGMSENAIEAGRKKEKKEEGGTTLRERPK